MLLRVIAVHCSYAAAPGSHPPHAAGGRPVCGGWLGQAGAAAAAARSVDLRPDSCSLLCFDLLILWLLSLSQFHWYFTGDNLKLMSLDHIWSSLSPFLQIRMFLCLVKMYIVRFTSNMFVPVVSLWLFGKDFFINLLCICAFVCMWMHA